MRTPLSWLRDFAPLEGDTAHLASTLDDLGLVVEEIETVGEGLDDVVVARVLEIAPIEGADRIRMVVVDAGGEPVEVVCGASNFVEGDLVPFVPVGAVLPGGFEIGRRTMKGVVSNGMLCSGRELGLSDDGAGLLVLGSDEGTEPGEPLVQVLGIEPDIVFDIAVEGNRPDALCMAGIARDLAARLGEPFSLPDIAAPNSGHPAAQEMASAVVLDPDLCPRLTVRTAAGITVGPSPAWMTRRLTLAGMRPINNVVDASNYVMLELGQPNHPYDLDRLGGSGLRVRRARPSEVLVTLDGVERELGIAGRGLGETGEDCLICDADDVPVGIAGIMGGQDSEISEGTSRVLLETAYFTPMAIARTSKRLGLRTEASARFERGCDPWGIERAADRYFLFLPETAPEMVLADGSIDVRGEVPSAIRVRVPLSRVNGLLGTDLGAEEVAGLLSPIGFDCEEGEDGSGSVLVTVPTNRPDIRPERFGIADVAEEVARTFGYSKVGRRYPAWAQRGGLDRRQRERRQVREVLCGLGALEAWTSSFAPGSDDSRIGQEGPSVEVTNPLVSEERFLRRTQMLGLLRALEHNVARRQGSVRLFELGIVFLHPDVAASADGGSTRVVRSGAGGLQTTSLPLERELLSAVFAADGDDARTAVAAWHVLAQSLRLANVSLGTLPRPALGMHPTRSASLIDRGSGSVVGSVGEVDPSLVREMGVGDKRVGWLEVDLGLLLDPAVIERRSEDASPVSRYPSSDIDLALVVPDSVPAARVAELITEAGGELLESVALFDVFRGSGVDAGSRSLAFRLRFCAHDHTLTDGEVGELRRTCVEATSVLGAALR